MSALSGTPGRFNLARQTPAADCVPQCQKLSDSLTAAGTGGLAAICTNDILSDYGACYSCQVKNDGLPQTAAQQAVDAYAQSCNNGGHAVNKITIAADGSVSGGAAAAAGTAAGAATGAAAGAAPTGGSAPTGGKTSGAARTSEGTLVVASALVTFLSFTMVL
ncbi:hypothetical protein C8R46DRAFT_1081837 [Mycena filopes]|nr:hypothetical protein C8R46DRAFT_1081837 [Mycena filopes]